MDIRLNVYDLPNAARTNAMLNTLGIGLFHSGVEINNVEYSFSAAGISRTTPRLPEFGVFKESIVIGRFTGSINDVYLVIDRLRAAPFRVGAYDLISLNCNSFSDALCFALVDKHIPEWVNRAANIAASIAPADSSSSSSFSSGSGLLPALGTVSSKSPIFGVKPPVAVPAPAPAAAPAAAASSSGSSIFSWLFGASASTPSSGEATGGAKATAPTPAARQTGAVVKEEIERVDRTKKREMTEQQREMLARLKNKT